MNPPPHAAFAALAGERLDWRFKGVPPDWQDATVAEILAAAPVLFEAGPTGPVCVLRAAALAHNLAAMATWCRDRGVLLAPHGKTHMSPQLFARQSAAGACAVTVATIAQARVYRAFGVDAVVLANELVEPAGLAWLARELDTDPGFGAVCWVDSVRGVQLMTDALAGATRALDVCVEVGMPGGRTGARTAAEVDEVARAAAASPRLRLVGVAGYEAALGGERSDGATARVRSYLAEMRAAVTRLAPLFGTDEVIVTAGGSSYPDVVADELAGAAQRVILRSGCYLTHDHGLYAATSPLPMRPAMQVWAPVLSHPEPGLALVGMGRRDVSFDAGLPVPLSLPGATVTKLNDQHAYLETAGHTVTVGDRLGFGISHPCTTFDKWQLIPVLDDADRVVDLVRTFF
ncbi:D-amino acid deaminase [Mycolicibacterium canariasense]|uniref:D-amino acid deaminase n=1 Tax=Mycolicibacterium canariasense TaxID=228230 RepID=A0A100WAS9_MYCCR|nr:alanine racemase [Mycolicibacterium canariasense]MCV7208484.1 alanine racemase [Mycolicibacterium canariasense]ORV07407.1 amino acid deaminase [Mycolicibacterium canariasense]GAS94731.1 D-amino acid deaminase [Mycolicibacterium canariasense]